MRFQKKIIYSITFALIVFFSSMFINFIPCQIAPEIPNSKYSWKLCNFNPDLNMKIMSSVLYLGYTSSLMEAYFLVLLISFIIPFTIFHFQKSKGTSE